MSRLFQKHTKTYYRYLFSYVALLAAGILMLLIFFQFYFISNLRSSLISSEESALQQTAQGLDNDLSRINAIDYQISSFNDNFLSYYQEEPSPMRDLRLVREYQNMLSTSTFISESALFSPHSDSIYTSTAVYSKDLFFDSIFVFDQLDDPISFFSALNTRVVCTAKRQGKPQVYFVFVNPPSVFSRLNNAVQFFFVKEEEFISRLAPADSYRQGAIVDPSGNVILSSIAFDAADISANDSLKAGQHEYLVLRRASEVLDWEYLALIPLDEFMVPVQRAYVSFLLIVGVFFVVGVLGISYCMHITYTPLKELTLALGGPQRDDDVESLRTMIGTLSQQNETTRALMVHSPDGKAMKDALLFALLKNKFETFDAFNREGAPLGMQFTKPVYQVLMLRYFGEEEEFPYHHLESAMETVFGQRYCYHFRELFEQSTIICLIGMDEGMQQAVLDDYQQLIDHCYQVYNLSFTIGTSRCYQDLAQITIASFEASQAVKESFIRGWNQLICYHHMPSSMPAPGNYLSVLENLKTETPTQQMQSIERFVQLLKNKQVPSLMAKGYCNTAIQMLLASPVEHNTLPDLFSINYLKTVDDYLAFMLRIIGDQQDMPAANTPHPPEESDALLLRIYAILETDFDDCNFSIQETAEKLDLNRSYLSQYFKQQTGDTLTNHISSLRIKKACTMLETTTMPLQMISESVGYYNLNSFIRRFKQITGMTPGEYRRKYQ